MRVTTIRVRNFRNHADSELACADLLNVILGDNGQGKTNLLEAVSYVCLTKSFFGATDTVILKIGEPAFEAGAEIMSDSGLRYSVAGSYRNGNGGKTYSINSGAVDSLADVIGMFPVVVLAPEHKEITAGNPSERRRFLDMLISQSSRGYLEDLLEYRRVLKQRNKILLDARIARTDCSRLLEPWDEALARRGVKLTAKRASFVTEFSPYMTSAYAEIAGADEAPGLRYEPSIPPSESDAESACREALLRQRQEDRRIGSTQSGPHRDELKLTINELDVRRYASQGQHKTFLLALKVAEFHFLKEHTAETPVLLLDDVFGELDASRAHAMLELLPSLGQTFITATGEGTFPKSYRWDKNHKRFFVRGGAVKEAKRK